MSVNVQSPRQSQGKTTVSHTPAGQARSPCVHRQAAGRDYAAPLQLNGNGWVWL